MNKFLRIIDSTVNFTVLIFLLTFFTYNAYTTWENNSVYRRAYASEYHVYRPTQDETINFENLQLINPDVFGWLTVYGTNIDYPLLQTDNNHKYVNHNAKGEFARTGAIFLDFRNNKNLSDFNNIIYGHDMAREAMFGEIANFIEPEFFNIREFGSIFTGQTYYGIHFFAFLEVDAYDRQIYNPRMNIPHQKELFLERIKNDAINYRNIEVDPTHRIVILSTCTPTSTNGRHLLVGRLTDHIEDNVFITEIGDNQPPSFLSINSLGLGTISIIIFSIIGVISLMVLFIKKSKKTKNENESVVSTVKKKPLLTEIVFIIAKVIGLALIISTLFIFVFGVVQTEDIMMAPTMQEGDFVLFQRINQSYIANDLIVLSDRQTRRIVAVAGDEVDISERGLMVNNHLQTESHIFTETTQFTEGIRFPIIIPEDHVFVLGDNRPRATDSRIYGTVKTDDILGNVITIIRRKDL